MISNLSLSKCSSDSFRNIMKYILAFIDKEKQTESLIERLCQQRIRAATDDAHVADIAYCLTLLNYSEKGLKKIAENFKCYKDNLIVDSVYHCFLQIVQKAKKTCKAEMKNEIDEWESKIIAQYNGVVEEADPMAVENENEQVVQAKGKPRSPPKKAAARRGRQPKARKQTKKTSPTRTRTSRSKKSIRYEEEEEEEEEEIELESDDDEDDE